MDYSIIGIIDDAEAWRIKARHSWREWPRARECLTASYAVNGRSRSHGTSG
jgi:hypothetical protein